MLCFIFIYTESNSRAQGEKLGCLNHHNFISSTLWLISWPQPKIKEVHQNSLAIGDLHQIYSPAAQGRRKHTVSQRPLDGKARCCIQAAKHLLYLSATGVTQSLSMPISEQRMLWQSGQDCSSLWDIGPGLLCLLQSEDLSTNNTEFPRNWHGVSVFASIQLYLASYWFNKY